MTHDELFCKACPVFLCSGHNKESKSISAIFLEVLEDMEIPLEVEN